MSSIVVSLPWYRIPMWNVLHSLPHYNIFESFVTTPFQPYINSNINNSAVCSHNYPEQSPRFLSGGDGGKILRMCRTIYFTQKYIRIIYFTLIMNVH